MKGSIIRRIIELVRQAQELASRIGMPNILQPGLVKEMVIADVLGHQLIPAKHGADAYDPEDPNVKYEYLSCLEGGTGQLDRVFKEPPQARKESLTRISRNNKIYLAIFFRAEPLKLKVIYELEPTDVVEKTNEKLNNSRNDISHVGFSESWAKEKGRIIYP